MRVIGAFMLSFLPFGSPQTNLWTSKAHELRKRTISTKSNQCDVIAKILVPFKQIFGLVT